MTATVHRFGAFRFLPEARELWQGDRAVPLPRRSFECLEFLIAHRDRAVHRDELVAAVFGRPDVSDAQLGQVVLRTRRAVADDGASQHVIRTIAGFGYRWVADVETVLVEEPAASVAPQPPPPPNLQVVASVVPVNSAAAPPVAASSNPTSRLQRPLLALGAAALLLCVALVVGWSRWHATPAATGAAVAAQGAAVVLPLDVEGLREDGWVRLGAMDLVADRLRQAGLGVPPSESVLGLLSGHGAPDADAPDRLRAVTGARLLVRGKAVHEAAGWRVELAATAPDGLPLPVSASGADAVQAARDAADRLLAALGRTLPPGSEGEGAPDEALQRARAAMLANELDTARAILRASPLLAAEPDRLAFHLAQVDFRAGQLDEAGAALDRVLAHPATAADPRFHAQVLAARGATHIRRGEFAAGGHDFDAALGLLGNDGAPLERGRALLGRANSRVAAHVYDAALVDFGAARVALQSAGDGLGVTRVDANLGMLELYRGRPGAALGYLAGAADRFQSFGALHELLLTLTGLVDAQLALLQHQDALATVERALALRERITDPDQQVDLLLNHAQVLLGFGRYREAGTALARAREIPTSGNRVLLARARSLQARLAAQQADWRAVEAATAAALADWPGAGADGDRTEVLRMRQNALLALGKADAAHALFDRAPPPSAPAGTPGEVAAALAQAEWALQAGQRLQSAAWFDFAAASAEQRAVPAEIVAVARARAPLLLASGASDAAAAAIGRVAPWASADFDSALLQLRLFHALGQRDAWFHALRQAQGLAGERTIPPALLALQGASDTFRLGASPATR